MVDAAGRNARRGLEREPADFAHAGHKDPRIEAADHVAPALVAARAQVATVENAGIGVGAAAAAVLQTGGAAERNRVAGAIVPQPLRLWEAARRLVRWALLHRMLTSAVSPN